MSYICPRCYYKTDRKSSFLNHLKRKKICIRCSESYAKYSSDELDKIMAQYNSYDFTEFCDSLENYCCDHCDKTFSKKYNLNRHVKIKHDDINEKEQSSSPVVNNTYNIVNNIQNIQNIQQLNINITPISFDKDWDLSKIDQSNIHKILFSNVMYTKLLEEILKNEINLNVIIENESNSGLVYKNDIEKYVSMKLKDIADKSMLKLNKQLRDLHTNIMDADFLDDYVKKSQDIIDSKINDYKNNTNNIQEKVDEYIINMYNNVKDDAITICKKITNNGEFYNDDEVGY